MIEYIVIGLLAIGGAIGWLVAWRANKVIERMEDSFIDWNDAVGNFKMKIDALFDMNIHYYDETIFQFVEDVKELKNEMDKILTEYEDLEQYIYPENEKSEDAEQRELLGVVKSYGGGRKLM